MNIARKNLGLVFTVSLILFLAMPLFCPQCRFFFFAPFIVILYYQKPFHIALWASIFCGTILDCLSSSTPFGFYALAYALSTIILYEQHRHFFADKMSTLPLMVFFFSVVTTLIQSLLLGLFQRHYLFSWGWVFTDFLFFPLYDGFYAFSIFILPWILFGKRPRKGSEYFSN